MNRGATNRLFGRLGRRGWVAWAQTVARRLSLVEEISIVACDGCSNAIIPDSELTYCADFNGIDFFVLVRLRSGIGAGSGPTFEAVSGAVLEAMRDDFARRNIDGRRGQIFVVKPERPTVLLDWLQGCLPGLNPVDRHRDPLETTRWQIGDSLEVRSEDECRFEWLPWLDDDRYGVVRGRTVLYQCRCPAAEALHRSQLLTRAVEPRVARMAIPFLFGNADWPRNVVAIFLPPPGG